VTVTVLYFARMAEAAGCASEVVESVPATASALFDLVGDRHRFEFVRESLRVAIGDRLVSWNTVLRDGDEVAFIPPVSGG